VKASNLNKTQQLSTNGTQLVQFVRALIALSTVSAWQRTGLAALRCGAPRSETQLRALLPSKSKLERENCKKVSVHVQDRGEILKFENARLLRTQPIGNLLK
jgi:hypothetical protein